MNIESKIKSFDCWLDETFGHSDFHANEIKLMRFAYDNGVAEALSYVMSQVKNNEDNKD